MLGLDSIRRSTFGPVEMYMVKVNGKVNRAFGTRWLDFIANLLDLTYDEEWDGCDFSQVVMNSQSRMLNAMFQEEMKSIKSSEITNAICKHHILDLLISKGDLPSVKLLISNDQSLLKPQYDGAVSPLMRAVDEEQLDICTYLIDAGANINYQDDLGESALGCAIPSSNFPLVQLLLRHHAKNLTDKNGVTPAQYARKQNLLDIEQLILHSQH